MTNLESTRRGTFALRRLSDSATYRTIPNLGRNCPSRRLYKYHVQSTRRMPIPALYSPSERVRPGRRYSESFCLLCRGLKTQINAISRFGTTTYRCPTACPELAEGFTSLFWTLTWAEGAVGPRLGKGWPNLGHRATDYRFPASSRYSRNSARVSSMLQREGDGRFQRIPSCRRYRDAYLRRQSRKLFPSSRAA